jgi:hypothetical protein
MISFRRIQPISDVRDIALVSHPTVLRPFDEAREPLSAVGFSGNGCDGFERLVSGVSDQ